MRALRDAQVTIVRPRPSQETLRQHLKTRAEVVRGFSGVTETKRDEVRRDQAEVQEADRRKARNLRPGLRRGFQPPGGAAQPR